MVEICEDNFFQHMLPSDIFQNLITALRRQSAPHFFIMLSFYHFIKEDKNNSLQLLAEICQAIYLMCMLAKKCFLRFYEGILCLVQFVNNKDTSCFVCFYVNWVWSVPRLCAYSFLKDFVNNGRRNLSG